MPSAQHRVSSRNGCQIMVRGLRLRATLGYRLGVRVRVSDVAGNPANEPWVYTVNNQEHATLTSNDPPPPAWIQPGSLVCVDVRTEYDEPFDPIATEPEPATQEPFPDSTVAATPVSPLPDWDKRWKWLKLRLEVFAALSAVATAIWGTVMWLLRS
jgi:hypothetical protein